MQAQTIVKGEVTEITQSPGMAALARIVPGQGLPSRVVLIRYDHYFTSVHSSIQPCGRDFGTNISLPHQIRKGDMVLLRQHPERLDLAYQWCYDDGQAREVRAVIVPQIPPPPHDQGKPWSKFALKAHRRWVEQGIGMSR